MSIYDFSDSSLKLMDVVRQDECITPLEAIKEVDVGRIVLDAGGVEQGNDLFLAVNPAGNNRDAMMRHVQTAVDRGACVILKDAKLPELSDNKDSVVVDVYDARRLKAMIAARLLRGQPKKIVTVTGTNGKTSVVEFARQIFEKLGFKAASIGTLGIQGQGLDYETLPEIAHTSPDPFVLHQALSTLRQQGVTHVCLEASSHGLDQNRLDAVPLTAAGFTNLSPDHLDYHTSMEQYFEAKKRLFSQLLPPGETAVLNADTHHYDELYRYCKSQRHHVISYGKTAEEGLRILNFGIQGPKQNVLLNVNNREYEIEFNFIGKFQVLNVLCAVGMVMGTGVPAMDIMPVLSELKTAPGRLECVGETRSGGGVYVDYAHTPDALMRTLLSMRPYVNGRLFLLFGCGGDRDILKREKMAKIAEAYSDYQIITDDNPRTEDPAEIRKMLTEHCVNFTEIGDRREAIASAVKMLRKNDALVIAGKGHENFQIIGSKKVPLSDKVIAQEEISRA